METVDVIIGSPGAKPLSNMKIPILDDVPEDVTARQLSRQRATSDSIMTKQLFRRRYFSIFRSSR